MNHKVFDYQCPQCACIRTNVMVTAEEEDTLCCAVCSTVEQSVLMTKLLSAPKQFEKIIPTYPGSKHRKAGYQHKYVNRPATKTQVGVGGGITKGGD